MTPLMRFFARVFSRLANLDCNNVILGADFLSAATCFLNPSMGKLPSVTFAPQVSNWICDPCYD